MHSCSGHAHREGPLRCSVNAETIIPDRATEHGCSQLDLNVEAQEIVGTRLGI